MCRSYRALYILNWVYRFMTEPNYRQWLGKFFKPLSVHSCQSLPPACNQLQMTPALSTMTSNIMYAVMRFSVIAVWISGIVQTIIYIDFFYYYFKSWKNNEKLSLPA